MRLTTLAAGPGGHAHQYYEARAGLPYSYYNDIGPFEMRWGFTDDGDAIDLEFSLPSDIYIGLGIGCFQSKKCDTVIGNGGGGRGEPYVDDVYEAFGGREPETDVELGGTFDLTNVTLSTRGYNSVIRFRRKLDTGDKWDHVITKGVMDYTYAWCDGPFCVDTHSAHAPGSFNIIQVNMTGRPASPGTTRASAWGNWGDCYAGSDDLCACSTLIQRRVIPGFDDCTQTAAIAYCNAHGPCYQSTG